MRKDLLKKNKIIFLVIINFLVLLVGGIYISRLKNKINLDFSQDYLELNRTYLDENFRKKTVTAGKGFYVDDSYDGEGKYISTPSITLDRGIYEITVDYETKYGKSTVEAVSLQDAYNDIYSDAATLEKNINRISFNIYVNKNAREIQIRGNLFENIDDYLLIRNIHIKSFPLNTLYEVFKLLFGLIVFDFILLMLYLKKELVKFSFYEQRKVSLFLLASIAFLSSLPLFVDYLIWGHDLAFHLMRIEGLKDGLYSGAFPVKIQPTWCNNNGYAVGVFYGDLLLYIPAFLRVLRVPEYIAYKIYVAIINIVTVCISYFCFNKISKNKIYGILGCALYTLSMYRLTNVYVRAAVGEYTAMAFLPLILLGFYKVFMDDINDKNYKKNLWYLVIGFTGVIQSHILSFEMVVFFSGVVCLLMIKRTFRKSTFLLLLKSTFTTILLNLGFLIPLFDYMRDVLIINDKSRTTDSIYWIQKSGIYISQILGNSFNKNGQNQFSKLGMAGEMPLGIGLVFVIIGIIFLYILFVKNYSTKEGIFCLLLILMALFLTTNLFPYDYLCEKLGKLSLFITNLQFPWRFLSIASVLLSWLACIVFVTLSGKINWIEIKKL